MKVLICGAGIAGLTLAMCLDRTANKVVVVERARARRDEGYMIDFFGSGFDACDKLGLLSDLQRIHYPVESLTSVNAEGNERYSLPYPMLRRRIFDDRHFNFMRGDLEHVLSDKLSRQVEMRFGTTIEQIEQKGDSARVRLSSGSVETYDLVVGADGVHSQVRRLTFGTESGFTRFLGYYTAAFVVDKPIAGLDTTNAFRTLTVPGRQVAVYPIRGGKTATFFVHRAERTLSDFSREAAIRELRTAYGGMTWIVPELLERASGTANLYFDMVSQIEMSHWSVGRVVLVGDACQCVSLLAGQGASMAVAGAYVLAKQLDAAGRYVGNGLVEYERRVKPSITEKQEAGRRIADWFVPENAFRLALRDVGLRMSVWPITSSIVRKRLATDSIFQT